MNKYLDIAPEVAEALAAGKPVVALESTIISHGMPYPQNVETALKVEQIIREAGAVPATIAIIGGRLKAGLSKEEIDYLGRTGAGIPKASRRDLPVLVAQGTASHGVDKIGLYKVTMDSDYVWTAIAKYNAYTIDQLTTDGKRVKVNNTWFDLDDALVAKYEGTITKGKIDEEWTAKDLAEKSLIFVQYDDSKVGDTHDALVVYDLLIKALVNDEELGEYYGHQFATIKVDLKEYEKISVALMEKYNSDGTVGSTDLMSGVKYFDKDGKEVTMDADKGTKVAYAEISYSGVVTGDITYTTANQAAYADAKLVDKDSYFFTNQDQSAKVENDDSVTGIAGTITVNLKNATVSAGDLVTLLNKEAKANENQTIAGVYNTQDVESSKVAADANLAGDMLVKVVAWDNKTVAYYRIAVTNAPTV